MMVSLSPVQLLVQRAATVGGSEATLVSLILNADIVTKGVLVLLVLLSLLSWAIMFAKWRAFNAAESHGVAFMKEFERTRTVDDAARLAQRVSPSAFTAVFARAERFLNDTKPAMGATSERSARLSGSQVEALRLVLDAEATKERELLGRFITWLATVGSVSPLIGLLGTVLGVMSAFAGIVNTGSGNIAAVAPGIAAALSATAAALAVAIPAAFAYNSFAARLNKFDSALEGFGSELIALLVREGRV